MHLIGMFWVFLAFLDVRLFWVMLCQLYIKDQDPDAEVMAAHQWGISLILLRELGLQK